MNKRSTLFYALILLFIGEAHAQVDTSFIYNTSRPYGTLDIRIRKTASRYFYLQEGITVSFRESAPGVKSNTYLDRTSWDSSPYTEGNLREKNGSIDDFIMNYRLLFPSNYDATYDPGYPLVVFIHGAGERGNCWQDDCYHADKSWRPATNNPPAPTSATSKLLNNDHNLLHGGKNYLAARNYAGSRLPNDPKMPGLAYPGFVLFPQNLNGWDATSAQHVIRMVRLMAKKYNIDEDRIYITGLSNGGYGLYEIVKRAPWLFSAALPMSAPNDGGIFAVGLAPQVAHIPWWIFQGALDGSPPPSATESRVRILRDAGAVVRYTKYENLGHGTWNSAFKEPDYFRWILSQNKSKIHVFGGSPFICDGNTAGVRLELGEGFRAYMWEKNGVVISGADKHFIMAATPGTYRARFSRVANPTEADWNQWSDPVIISQTSQPAQAQLGQIGSIILPDPNGTTTAKLQALTKADYYYWYKDGVKLAIHDSTSMPTINPTSGNGAYTVVTAQYSNCPSPPSQAKYIFFSDQAPMNITSPINLTVAAGADNEVTLQWDDRSNNESGFEIWRRKALTSTKFTKWELITITTASQEDYIDNQVEPLTKYHYKIRAISNSGRSEYLPSGTAYVQVTTNNDIIKPSAPGKLTATITAVNAIQLNWNRANDNFGIKQYRISYEGGTITTGSSDTTYTVANLQPNTYYTFTVRAEDQRANISDPSNAVTADTYIDGLFYQHSTGTWGDLDDINWDFAEYRGKVTTFSLAPRTQEDFFNFKFDGYLYITNPGDYQFQTVSSDGSRIELEGAIVVSNDGIHANRTITSAVTPLTSGPKRITVTYFEYDESHVLTVKYKGPDTGNKWVVIPAEVLKSGDKDATITMQQLAVEEPEFEFDIYPNPTQQENINVRLQTDKKSHGKISLIDFTGREVYSVPYSQETEEVQLTPNESLKEGIYLIKISTGSKAFQKRISITR